ncbi:MAG: DUF4870 domain-containing protein [Patescibacteria group bacterium]
MAKIVFDKKDIEENKVVAALSYVWILFLVPLLAKRDSKYAQEHAKQGLILFIVWIVGSLVFWFPLIGWALAIIVLVLNVLAFIKCLQGEFWEIPVIGQYRSKFNL